jgi:hypothetical protein
VDAYGDRYVTNNITSSITSLIFGLCRSTPIRPSDSHPIPSSPPHPSHKHRTCMMGSRASYDDGPRLCYNAAKSKQMGWYVAGEQEVTGYWSGKMVCVDDYLNNPLYDSTQYRVLVYIGDRYLMFNRAQGPTIDIESADNNKVSVVQQNTPLTYRSNSYVEATLDGGQSYTATLPGGVGNIVIKVVGVNVVANPAYADVIVYNSDLYAENGVAHPTVPPTQSPTISSNPSSTPSTVVSLAPSVVLSDEPTVVKILPTPPPTAVPITLPPTRVPTSKPTSKPTLVPTMVPTTSSPSIVPTVMESSSPSVAPTTQAPTVLPSNPPSDVPSKSPTNTPTTAQPTAHPTNTPTTMVPSAVPTGAPVHVQLDVLPMVEVSELDVLESAMLLRRVSTIILTNGKSKQDFDESTDTWTEALTLTVSDMSSSSSSSVRTTTSPEDSGMEGMATNLYGIIYHPSTTVPTIQPFKMPVGGASPVGTKVGVLPMAVSELEIIDSALTLRRVATMILTGSSSPDSNSTIEERIRTWTEALTLTIKEMRRNNRDSTTNEIILDGGAEVDDGRMTNLYGIVY